MADIFSEIDLAPFIDRSLLHPCATSEYLRQGCAEADRFGFASVCVFPAMVREAAELLHGKTPKVSTVVGFPTGATTSAVKLYEAADAVENGATELDVVVNLAWLKTGRTNDVHRELAEICEETNVTVKAIIETNLLTPDEKQVATQLCLDAGVQFIVTCTGQYGGVNIADVSFLKEIARGQVGIKASAGIRTYEDAVNLVLAGASRLGTSRVMEILRDRDRQTEEDDNPQS